MLWGGGRIPAIKYIDKINVNSRKFLYVSMNEVYLGTFEEGDGLLSCTE